MKLFISCKFKVQKNQSFNLIIFKYPYSFFTTIDNLCRTLFLKLPEVFQIHRNHLPL